MAIKVIFNNIPGMADAVKAEVTKVIATTAADVEARAKEKAPVLTGNLRASISSQSSGLTGIVAVGADYGLYVEVGTHKMKAQPYLRPAMEDAKEGFIAGIQTAIGAAAKGLTADSGAPAAPASPIDASPDGANSPTP